MTRRRLNRYRKAHNRWRRKVRRHQVATQQAFRLRGEQTLPPTMKHWHEWYEDWCVRQAWFRRQAEKEASRQQDAEDLRAGKKTRKQLRQENGLFNHLAHEPLDWSKIVPV